MTPSATSSLTTATPSTPFQSSNVKLGNGCSSTQSMLTPAWSSPWTAYDRPPWPQSKPDESALLEKIKATCKVEEVPSVLDANGQLHRNCASSRSQAPTNR
jgi:hypothetical protein